MGTFFIALGANHPGTAGQSSLQTCEWAVSEVTTSPDVTLIGRSSWYRSAPIPVSDQPDFVNGVIAVLADMAPLAMLRCLLALESRAGRVRTVPNAARVLDLDLLAADSSIIESQALVLPHPRLHERAFVLCPLAEIAPEWRHPVLGMTAAGLLAQVQGQAIARIPGGPAALHVPARYLT